MAVSKEKDDSIEDELGRLDMDLVRKSKQHNLTSTNVRAILHVSASISMTYTLEGAVCNVNDCHSSGGDYPWACGQHDESCNQRHTGPADVRKSLCPASRAGLEPVTLFFHHLSISPTGSKQVPGTNFEMGWTGARWWHDPSKYWWERLQTSWL